MNTMNTRSSTPAFAVIGLLVGLLVYQSQANRTARTVVMAAPTVVATVDLEGVFNALTEKGVQEDQLRSLAQQLVDEHQVLKAEIDELRLDLEDYPAGGEKFLQIEDQVLRKSFDYEARVNFAKRLTEIRNADIIKEIYLNIKAAAARLAQAKGIDLVFVDDTKVEIQPGDADEINRQISARRMLYVNPAIDITAELIALMNGEFQARGGN